MNLHFHLLHLLPQGLSIALGLLFLSNSAVAQLDDAISLREAHFIQSKSENPPASSANWQETTLPYTDATLASDDFNEGSSTWFRFQVSRDINAEVQNELSLGLYIPRHNIRLSVFLDDNYLGGSSQLRYGQKSSAWNHPLLLDLPTTVMTAEHIYIHLIGGPSGPILTSPIIAAQTSLETLYDERYFWQITTSQWSFGICLIMAFLAAWIWSQRREETLYLQVAGMSVCWAISLTLSFFEFIPFNFRLWAFFLESASDWGAYLLVSYVLASAQLESPRVKNCLFYTAILATIVHLVIPDKLFFQTALIFNGLESLAVFWVVLLLFRQAVTQPQRIRIWFCLAFAGVIILMAHDIYVVFILPEEQWVQSSNWMHMALPLITIAFYGDLVSRFTRALSETETLNRDLEQRVADSRMELESIYARNREFELEKATNDERNKIYRDLHDDVGSKLATILHRENDDSSPEARQADTQTKQLARSALESLRAAIFRANFSADSVADFLRSVTEEMEIRLLSAGLTFDCNNQVKEHRAIDAKTAYHLTRIFRELTSNILHHADASSVHLKLHEKNKHLYCELSDDGVGILANNQENEGMSSVHFRASELNGEVVWEKPKQDKLAKQTDKKTLGTCVNLAIPLQQSD